MDRVDKRLLERGDTATWLERKTQSQYEVEKWNEQLLSEMLLPVFGDPGMALTYGLSSDNFFESVRAQLMYHPVIGASDTTTWHAKKFVYETLTPLWRTGRDARTRSLGLLTLMTRDPKTWSDTVRNFADSARGMLDDAVQLIHGVGATWPAASKKPMPAAGSSWREWLEWMGGYDPNFRISEAAPQSAPKKPELRFEQSHRNAIRFFEARSGRNISAEFQLLLPTASEDSALMVYAQLLAGLGELKVSSPELERRFTTGPRFLVAFAERLLPHLFAHLRDAATPVVLSRADSSLLFKTIYTVALSNGTGTAHAANMPELICVDGLGTDSLRQREVIDTLQAGRTLLVLPMSACSRSGTIHQHINVAGFPHRKTRNQYRCHASAVHG